MHIDTDSKEIFYYPVDDSAHGHENMNPGRWWRWAELPCMPEVTFASFPLSAARVEAVLCRTNAQLIMLHYKFLAQGVRSQLSGGKEASSELLRLLNAAVRQRHWTGSRTLERGHPEPINARHSQTQSSSTHCSVFDDTQVQQIHETRAFKDVQQVVEMCFEKE